MKQRIFKYGLLAALIAATFLFGCPIYRLLHVQCPVCGTTRAWLAAFGGDFTSAFAQNAFFPLVPMAVVLFVLRDAERLAKYRRGVDAALAVFAAVLFVYNIARQVV